MIARIDKRTSEIDERTSDIDERTSEIHSMMNVVVATIDPFELPIPEHSSGQLSEKRRDFQLAVVRLQVRDDAKRVPQLLSCQVTCSWKAASCWPASCCRSATPR